MANEFGIGHSVVGHARKVKIGNLSDGCNKTLAIRRAQHDARARRPVSRETLITTMPVVLGTGGSEHGQQTQTYRDLRISTESASLDSPLIQRRHAFGGFQRA